MELIIKFESWFSQLISSSQQLVLNNIIAKLSSTISEKIEDDELPF